MTDGGKVAFVDLNRIDSNSGYAAIAIDPIYRTLFISDLKNHRILNFGSVDNLNATSSPVAVLGRPDLTLNTIAPTPPTQFSLNFPKGLFVDVYGTLWVADTLNNRVLWFRNASNLADGSGANGVVGQPSFVTYFVGLNSKAFNQPVDVSIDSQGTLWVTDQQNHRVLRFDGATSNSFPPMGAAANLVVGHTNFFQNTPSPCSSASLSSPNAALNVIGQGLYVVDGFSRVLFFLEAELTFNGGSADFVYGQATFNTSAPVPIPTASSIGQATAISLGINGNAFIGDAQGNRVLVFSAPPTSNNQPATFVIGEPDFSTNSGGMFFGPFDVFYDAIANSLYVTDNLNSKLIRYRNVLAKSTLSVNTTVELEFLGDSPQAHLLPKDNVGHTFPGHNDVFLSPSVMEEVDPLGNVIATNSLLSTVYDVDTTPLADDSELFVFSSPMINLTYHLYLSGQSLSSAGVSFITKPHSLKFELSLSQWNFSSPSTPTPHNDCTPRRHKDHRIGPHPQDSEGVMTTEIDLIDMCTVDGSLNLPVNFTLNVIESVPGNFSLLDLVMELPFFNQSLVYDPDFSVTLTGGSGDGGDGSNDNLLGLLALIALVIPVALVLIAVAILAGVYSWRKLRLGRFAPRDDVNF